MSYFCYCENMHNLNKMSEHFKNTKIFLSHAAHVESRILLGEEIE